MCWVGIADIPEIPLTLRERRAVVLMLKVRRHAADFELNAGNVNVVCSVVG